MKRTLRRNARTALLRQAIPGFPLILLALALLIGSQRATASPLVRVPADTPDLQAAISQVDDGGIIEVAGGTYPAPAGAFRINDVGKGFTIRAASGANVVLDGGGSTDILRFMNSSPTSSGPVLFQDIIFANGRGTTEGLAAGVTLYRARATFVRCQFYRNAAVVTTTVGGGIYVAEQSTVHFLDTLWIENTSRTGGAGLGIRTDTDVFVHRGQFIRNRATPPNHVVGAGGAGINVGNARLWVTDTRFEGNQAASFGGALYGIGNWQDPVATPRAEVTIANSTFVDNVCQPDPSVPTSLPTEGGAVNVEDQTTLRIFNSRFLTNRAQIGGGVNVYRALAEIRGSVFRGNRATDTAAGSGFGGAISASSGDGPTDPNRRPAQLTVEDSLIQGRYGAVTTVAQTAGGIYASGDGFRVDGDPGVPDMGTIEENRATVVIRRVTFYDCDVTAPSPRAGIGGAMAVPVTDLTIEDSLFVGSDSLGSGAAGGALVVFFRSVATVLRSSFIGNTAATYGGAIFVQGSTLDLADSHFAENEVSPGVNESEANSFGAALFAAPDDARGLIVDGLVEGNTFSRNVGIAIFDDDRSGGPINDVRYDDNDFFSESFSGKVYRDSLTVAQTPSGLNALVVSRNSGVPSTDKSTGGNAALGSAPELGALLAMPQEILSRTAAGDPPGPSTSYLAAGWSGGNGELEGEALTGSFALRSTTDPGTFTLFVDSTPFSAFVTAAEVPTSSLSASPPVVSSGGASDLLWSLDAGTLVQASLDQGIGLVAGTAGSQMVAPPRTRTYRLLAVTQEGGAVDSATVFVDSPAGLPAPGITAPAPGQVIGVTSVTFSWGAVGGTQFYDLRAWRQADGAVVF
ncbi:MAG TPA: right-handed parallel beta-helix repeat-containing protein, partial [Longimicrobiaceae bacterium]|nr:right-handed parallel beta-helix repeat-containing protein [Longimicrobiaceae bacterium]